MRFCFFIEQPKLVAVSNIVAFANPNAPVYPRLAQGKTWNEVSSFSFPALYLHACSLFMMKLRENMHQWELILALHYIREGFLSNFLPLCVVLSVSCEDNAIQYIF